MIQSQMSHPPGTFAVCPICGREPMHILARGRAASELPDLRSPCPALRHTLECGCGRMTGKHADLCDAVAEWGAAHAQGELVTTLGLWLREVLP